jgi:uncharacterized protein
VNPTHTRRQTIKLLAAGAGALALGLYTWGIEPHWLEFTYSDLSVAGLPRELEGRTLAQISDLHVGPAVDDAYVIESLQRVGQPAPDFIAIMNVLPVVPTTTLSNRSAELGPI